jgi:hypothetical protein
MVKSEARGENSTGARPDVAHCGPRALGMGRSSFARIARN